MKKSLKGFIVGFLVCALLSATTVAFGAGGTMKELFYNGIKIFVDGAEFKPTDGNGNAVAPFIMDGSTYLPVRAVSNALGVDVQWDGATQSVYLGKKTPGAPDTYLDRIQYTDFEGGSSSDTFYRINGTITDVLNDTYTNGIILYSASSTYNSNGDRLKNDSDNANLFIDYPLNSQYQTLNGKVVLPTNISIAGLSGKANDRDDAVDVLFYGDGRLLNKTLSVTKTMPLNFTVNVGGVNMLTIKVVVRNTGWSASMHTALTDLALYK